MHSAPSSIYIHIPFCRSKCSYCDFFSVPEKGALPDSYITALCNNIAFRCREFGVQKLDTVYIGGGTPSLLSQNQLTRILEAVRNAACVSSAAEITIEANPADITPELLAFYSSAGISRLSVGIQSVDQKVLAALGRRSDAERVEKVLTLLESEWLSYGTVLSEGQLSDNGEKRGRRLSLDLIAGLPGLSDESFRKGVERVIATGADHISLYSLMLEEGTRLEEQVSSGAVQYSDEVNDRQWIMGRDMLTSAGYAQYEVSNFARPGFESRHNTVYWHMNDYIGAGAGGTGTVGSYRWTESPDICAYTSWWNGPAALKAHAALSDDEAMTADTALPYNKAPDADKAGVSDKAPDADKAGAPAEVEHLDDATREFEFLMMGFRLLEGVSAREYEMRFGKSLEKRLGAGAHALKADDALSENEACGADKACTGLFYDWQMRGLARTYSTEDGDTRYALTAEGILLLNQFLEALL